VIDLNLINYIIKAHTR